MCANPAEVQWCCGALARCYQGHVYGLPVACAALGMKMYSPAKTIAFPTKRCSPRLKVPVSTPSTIASFSLTISAGLGGYISKGGKSGRPSTLILIIATTAKPQSQLSQSKP